jgi:NAD(P)-dependent dehydrogenase (short-subunit alcohol dehydrogenase family)
MSLNPAIRDWRGLQVWLIGASSGIGEATARALAARGARVALTSRRREALEALAGPADLVVPADVTERESLAAAFDQVRDAFGAIDLAIVNAGTHQPVRAWELDAAAAEALVRVNLVGAINACALLAPYFAGRGSGHLALTASVAGYGGLPTSLAYGATKAGLINFAETLYLDLAPKGVAVHLINPGFVKTPLTDLNEFSMPALIGSDEAAREILAGFERGDFEIHFPKRFTRSMKLLRLLPYRWYFPLVHRITGL